METILSNIGNLPVVGGIAAGVVGVGVAARKVWKWKGIVVALFKDLSEVRTAVMVLRNEIINARADSVWTDTERTEVAKRLAEVVNEVDDVIERLRNIL